ncbi:hypothetical protein ZWY2020_044488 [Hordeum vulgare]|nr:hypothetical protein ZWY2020_044488 [Hordeum vulgare]
MAQAISLVVDLDTLRVIFKTDYQLLVDDLDLRKVDSSPYTTIIEDLKFELKMWFSKHVVSTCGRSANFAAVHELASIGDISSPRLVAAAPQPSQLTPRSPAAGPLLPRAAAAAAVDKVVRSS